MDKHGCASNAKPWQAAGPVRAKRVDFFTFFATVLNFLCVSTLEAPFFQERH